MREAILRRIAWVPARKPDHSEDEQKKSKLYALNSASSVAANRQHFSQATERQDGQRQHQQQRNRDPAVEVLTSAEANEWSWRKDQHCAIGSGLLNAGQTCFANATLQALTYTQPLASFLTGPSSLSYHPKCDRWCVLCVLRAHFARALSPLKNQVRPS